jgi:hypothetical protein
MGGMLILSPHNRLFLGTLILGGGLFFAPEILGAEGSVKDLEKAIKSGKKQILFAGKENEDLTIKANIAVTGTSPDKALIYGDIKMENGSSLSNVTVAGKKTVITIAKGASVTLSNVTVRGGSESGIFAPEGGGTLTIKNSRILKNRKGFYILPGKNLNISGNVVSGNDEEGLDVRAGTSGSIVGNQFVNNGEGGAEIIVGSARLTISRNTFSGNKSSGLALQAYSGIGKAPGNVQVSNNTFSNNGNFGLVCSSPSRGGAGGSFFQRVIRLVDNTFQGNKAGNIDPVCATANRQSQNNDASRSQTEVSADTARMEREKLRHEAIEYFATTTTLLHDEEYLLEMNLNEYEASLTQTERLFHPTLSHTALEKTVRQIERINTLRRALEEFPEEWLSDSLRDERDALVNESLRRMEELRQYFERLQKPLFWQLVRAW